MNKKTFKAAVEKDYLFLSIVPAAIWQVLFLVLPVAFLVVISFLKMRGGDFSGLTFSNYSSLFNAAHIKVLLRSSFFALFNTIVCLLVSYPVAYFISIKAKSWKNTLLFFLVVPFFTNMLVLAYSWYFVLDENGFIKKFFMLFGYDLSVALLYNQFATILVLVYCYIPFMALPIYSALEKIDKTLFDASADLGASYSQTFFKIIFPLSFTGIKTGFILIFIMIFGEFTIPTLLGKGEPFFVGTLISYYFLQVKDPAMGAAFTFMSCLFLIGLFFVVSILFTLKRKANDKK